MRRIMLIALLTSTAATAQVSAPLVSHASHTGVSEHLHTIGLRAQTSAYAVREFRPDRNHMRTKLLPSQQGGQSQGTGRPVASALSVSLAAPGYTQTATFQPLGAPIGSNFEALGIGTPGFAISGAPPDTTLAVSATQIVQWVNSQIGIYNKSGTPLLPAPGFVNGNLIWSALGSTSLCATTNRGDPIVQYDRIAKRWILSQFAFNGTFSNNAQCIAVSQTDNALGAYNLYEYNFGSELPDYGKLGVWSDAYYITYNMFQNGRSFTSARACAYDRAAMLMGGAATQICFASPDHFSYLPSDLDGPTLPPAGTPNIHVSWNFYDTIAPYTMQLTKFVPNFQTPALSTFNDGFGGATFSSVGILMDSATQGACNDSGRNCVPQLGTTNTLDTLGDRHMYRLVYRNFGTYDALLVTQAVDVSTTSSTANLRWWEIRSPAANPPVVYQNSNFIPNSEARWMSSAAFDKLGNIGIGYSASSAAINPAIRITGRLRNDPKNLLRAEVLVQAGSGSQTVGLTRWGDYSTMQIDPANECTFWYTTQYIGTNGTFNWRTRIASFKFPNCS